MMNDAVLKMSFLDKAFQAGQSLIPFRRHKFEVFLHASERLPIKLVKILTTDPRAVYDANVLQDIQMLGDRLARERCTVGERRNGPFFTGRQFGNQPEPCLVTKCRESPCIPIELLFVKDCHRLARQKLLDVFELQIPTPAVVAKCFTATVLRQYVKTGFDDGQFGAFGNFLELEFHQGYRVW